MANLLDRVTFNEMRQNSSSVNNLQQMLFQARQNPAAFEEQFKKANPQAYQQALQIRNSGNPQAAIIQMLQARGINPNMLSMLGLK